jgi:hypothetical protein
MKMKKTIALQKRPVEMMTTKRRNGLPGATKAMTTKKTSVQKPAASTAMTTTLRMIKETTLTYNPNFIAGQLWRVAAPHFVAGIIVAQDGAIVAAAPILKWAYNRPFAWFRQYCKRKHWDLKTL